MVENFSKKIGELARIIGGGKVFCIVAHTSPDGDAVGSCVGMREYLKAMGKDARIVLPDRFPDFLGYLDSGGEILLYDADKEAGDAAVLSSDVVICMDCNSFSRTDHMEGVLKKAAARKILIDHHIAPDTASFNLIFSSNHVSSTCELAYYILKALCADGFPGLPAMTAEALFTGMTTDTNNFANSTYPSTLAMASELLAAGVDRPALLNRLYNQFSEGRLRLIGELLHDGMKIVDGKFSYMLLPKGLQRMYGYSKGDVEGVVNRPLEIKDVLVSALFTEDDDFVRVSLRSKPWVDVNLLAREYFNGGGHMNASGGRLKMDIADVPEYFENAIRRYAMQAHLL